MFIFISKTMPTKTNFKNYIPNSSCIIALTKNITYLCLATPSSPLSVDAPGVAASRSLSLTTFSILSGTGDAGSAESPSAGGESTSQLS